jgi:hypothetical protein
MNSPDFSQAVAAGLIMISISHKRKRADCDLRFPEKIQEQISGPGRRLDSIEKLTRKPRRDAAGMLVMMKATAGDFDERVSAVEERMGRLGALPG